MIEVKIPVPATCIATTPTLGAGRRLTSNSWWDSPAFGIRSCTDIKVLAGDIDKVAGGVDCRVADGMDVVPKDEMPSTVVEFA